MANDMSAEVLSKFRQKYLWWTPVDGQPFSDDRIIAQTMSLATYDDILLLEQSAGRGLWRSCTGLSPAGSTIAHGISGEGG
jgi:hypothetical protein